MKSNRFWIVHCSLVVLAWLATPGAAQARQCTASDSGLIAYWPFDDGMDPTEDVAGGHDGDVVGAAFTAGDIAPVPGNVAALAFNGLGDHVVMADPEAFSFNADEPMSISLWLQQTEPRSVYHVLGKREGCRSDIDINYQLARDPAQAGPFFFSTGAPPASLGNDFCLERWTHVAVAYDGAGTVRLYRDGLQVAAVGDFTLQAQNADPLRVATSGACPAGETFPGLIDEVRIYGRPLEPQEVAALAGACCPADLDGDGTIGTSDLLILLAAWGPCQEPCPPCRADLDGNRTVGTRDLLALLGGWGPCPAAPALGARGPGQVPGSPGRVRGGPGR